MLDVFELQSCLSLAGLVIKILALAAGQTIERARAQFGIV
jgi:hypothetical protein